MTQPYLSPFRVTPEDLPGLDSKTRNGLAPLLDALNGSVQQLFLAAQAVPVEEVVSVTLQIDTSVAAMFPLTFRNPLQTRPRVVELANITPKDVNHVLTAPFVMQGWGLTDAGLVSVPWITNLLASNTYTLSFAVR